MNTSQDQQILEVSGNLVIMQDRIKIQKRINFLQNNLIQLSFYNKSKFEGIERSELYKNLLDSLKSAKKLLNENKRIRCSLRMQD